MGLSKLKLAVCASFCISLCFLKNYLICFTASVWRFALLTSTSPAPCGPGSLCSVNKTSWEPSPALLLAASHTGLCRKMRNRPRWSPPAHGFWGNARKGDSTVKREYLHNAYLPWIAKNTFHECFYTSFPRFLAWLLRKGALGLSAQACTSGFIH